jgi:hypothetical protein
MEKILFIKKVKIHKIIVKINNIYRRIDMFNFISNYKTFLLSFKYLLVVLIVKWLSEDINPYFIYI